ncbi:MAG: pyrroline-5-carboxylate reductase dimerization domain-containing protein [Hoeflea sp. D1-CHI-28]
MKLGVIGVGHLADTILRGLLRAGLRPEDICLSPRGHGPQMAREHGFLLADDNAAVVAASDLVLLAVRPGDAEEAVSDLPWREDQVLMSACAGVPTARLAGPSAPASVVRIMPITASELGASPTIVYPMDPAISPFLDAIGTTMALDTEEQFEAATVSAAIYGWAQDLIRTSAEWGANRGLDPALARQLAAQTFVAAGRIQSEQEAPMGDILASLCTPGGITAAGLERLEQEGIHPAWERACELVLDMLSAKK